MSSLTLSPASFFLPFLPSPAGTNNVITDALSRIIFLSPSLAAAVSSYSSNYPALANVQGADPDLTHACASSLLHFELVHTSSCNVWCDISTGVASLFVSYAWRRVVFNAVYGLTHPGTRTTRKLLMAKFVCPSMARDVTTWTRACISCHRSKVWRHAKAPLQVLKCQMDIFSTFMWTSSALCLSGCRHLTLVNHFTRWPEAVLVADTSAVLVVRRSRMRSFFIGSRSLACPL